MLMHEEQAITRVVIGDGWAWLVVALDPFVPQFGGGNMDDTPTLSRRTQTPLCLLPIIIEPRIQRADLVNHSPADKDGAAGDPCHIVGVGELASIRLILA